MFWDEGGVLAQPVRITLDRHHNGVVQPPVQQRDSDDRIAEDLAPFTEAAAAGHDHGAALVTGIDQLEEQLWAYIPVLPTRLGHPRDKSKVEAGVQIAGCWILAQRSCPT